ncbi:alpha/beta fold hydrolase [Micromonospora sp. NRRL B-16802]|uniref:alpha/beta fold hydrolase n=1 Tax=Micromonospora sp. NRRL B-16802 TaxID=1415541 RepID=UPI0006AE7CC4|nr:alpha/beta hydrolase [Micromonospora sp. NRRL B-16802]
MTEGPSRALATLVEAVRQLEGLTGQVGPFALPDDTCDRAPDLVAAVCRALDVPLTFDAPSSARDRDFAVVALAAEIQRAQRAPELAGLRPEDGAAQARRLHADEEAGYRIRTVPRANGTVITVVESGPPDAPGVLISPPCSLSYRIALPWLRALNSSYRCVIMQTRGTTEPIVDEKDFDRRGYDLSHQVQDLVAVVDELALGPAHVMGLCAGASVALAATAQRPDLVSSLSLWHADLEMGGDAEKTDHQVNLRALMDLGGESRDTAAWLRGKLTSGPMTGVPAGIGPLVVRPYATTELFYRYAKLTAATMHWDSRPTAAGVHQPCLVITSEDDDTAHPAGSRRLAEIVPGARLVVAEHGNHLDAFRATAEQVRSLRSFLAA